MANMMMGALLLVIVIVGVRSAEDAKVTCVDAHNILRRLHENTRDLQWDATLATQATVYAEQLVDMPTLKHDNNRGERIGENLYYRSQSNQDAITCAKAVLSWYNEISNYDYNTADVKSSCYRNFAQRKGCQCHSRCQTGHFTQLIWEGETTHIGMGTKTAKVNGLWKTVWVARYKKLGNFGGPADYKANVNQKISGWKLPCIECGKIIKDKTCKAACADGNSDCPSLKIYCPEDMNSPTIPKTCPKTCGICTDFCAGGNNNNNGVAGGWSAWTNTGPACSKKCGGGKRDQKRTCTQPRPQNGGATCKGNSRRKSDCNKQDCPQSGCKDKKTNCGKYKYYCGFTLATWSDGTNFREECKATCKVPPCGGGGRRACGQLTDEFTNCRTNLKQYCYSTTVTLRDGRRVKAACKKTCCKCKGNCGRKQDEPATGTFGSLEAAAADVMSTLTMIEKDIQADEVEAPVGSVADIRVVGAPVELPESKSEEGVA